MPARQRPEASDAVDIAITNPNTTAAMTEGILSAALAAASPGTRITATQSADGPDAIEGPFDGVMAVPGMLAAMQAEAVRSADAHVIACFDDTGLDTARSVMAGPVVGIGEAGMHLAALVGHRFCIVTTLARSAPVLEDNARRYGLGSRCVAVLASDIPVLALHEAASGARERISEHIRAGRFGGAEAVVLGCAGMAHLARDLQAEHGIPVIEGVGAAVGLAEALVRCGLGTSRASLWAAPTRLHLLHRG
jgi:allantoin racemase